MVFVVVSPPLYTAELSTVAILSRSTLSNESLTEQETPVTLVFIFRKIDGSL